MPFGGLLIGGIGALGSAIGGAVGGAAASGDRAKELAMKQQALQNIMGVNTPDIEQMKIALQQYQSAGQLNPEAESITNAQDSLMNGVSVDPRLRDAQMKALSSLQEVGQGGLRPEDRAALGQIQSQVAQDERAREQALIQNMQQRGIAGSGAELAAQLSSSQGAANRQSQQGMDIGAQASQRALQAIMQSGQLGSSMEGQQFGEEAQKAAAQDVINKYNAMNQQQVGNANVSTRNAAQEANLGNQQNLMNANTQLMNQQQQYNKSLAQQDYENKLRRAQAAAAPTQNVANAYGESANRAAQTGASIGAGVGTALGGIAGNSSFQNLFKPKPAAPDYSGADGVGGGIK